MFEIAKENYFHERAPGDKSTRNKSRIGVLKSSAITAGSLKESKTKLLSSTPHELCDRRNLLLQEKKSRISVDLIGEENVAILDKKLK